MTAIPDITIPQGAASTAVTVTAPAEAVTVPAQTVAVQSQVGGVLLVAQRTHQVMEEPPRVTFYQVVERGILARGQALFVHHGSSAPDAARQAQGLAYGLLVRQANMLAFADTFYIFGLMCMAMLPLLFFMKKTYAGTKPIAMDH